MRPYGTDPSRDGADRQPAAGRRWSATVLYVVLLAGTVGTFFAVCHWGQSLAAPGTSTVAARLHGSDGLAHLLLALTVTIAAAKALGLLFARLDQPAVIGEVLAGILLGPTALGRLAPQVAAYVLPASVVPLLGALSQVGVVFYMFLVGLDTDLAAVRARSRATIAISHASILAPFLLGLGLALVIYPRLGTHDVRFTTFALFLAVAMSVTAFPVLARILTDRGEHTTPISVMALTCAAVDDVTAWCLLALVVSVASSRLASGLMTAALSAGYVAVMLLAINPLVRRLIRRADDRGDLLGRGLLVGVFVGLLLSALVTELIGIHAIFGAFVLGVIVPHDSRVARQLRVRLEDLVVIVLLPAFFAYTGLRTQLGLVTGAVNLGLALLVIVTASLGKFGGASLAARAAGLPWNEAATLGILMNTRGLVELVVLNVGLDLGVISSTLFAIMVLMALVTTLATTPALALLARRRGKAGAQVIDTSAGERAA